jgi:serine/threonine protein kinase
MQHLKNGSSLQGGKYKIEKVLGQGGFGITYLATQELLDRKVCIKEFFFKEYCERDEATSHVTLGTQSSREMVERFMAKFLKEARTISKLEHPNIIRIHDIFMETHPIGRSYGLQGRGGTEDRTWR